VFGSRFLGGPHRVLYFWHSVGNGFLTLVSNMFTDLNLTDMETCYKMVRRDLMQSLPLKTDRFGIEPELTARLAQARARIYEVPISYHGRTYAEGKKINWKDGVAAFWHIVRSNVFDRKAPVAIIGARVLPDSFEARLRALAGSVAARASLTRFALLAGALAAVLGTLFVLLVLKGQANLIDGFAQLLHARFLADGRLAGPADPDAFRALQNAVHTDNGWVSQYPPGHVLVLAIFMRLGAAWAAGPFMLAMAVIFTTLAAARLLPGRAGTVRLAGLLLALSPFFIVVGAAYMNHVTTAALVAVAAWALLRAWHERPAWALVAGVAFGWSLATRPLSTVAMAAALTLLVPFTVATAGAKGDAGNDVAARPDARRFVGILLLMAAGSLPFVAALLAWNAHFFGGPFTFGYDVALGPRMGLGFHLDPWGNLYGLREAVAYTNADVMALGVNLFESPVPAVLVVGVFLLIARRVSPGERVLLGWALLPVVTNFFYWHHGNFMGPRMLHDAVPAWVVLFSVAAVRLVERVPRDVGVGAYRARPALVAVLVAATVAGLLVLSPQRALSYGGEWREIARTPVPQLDEPALVFVHDAWMGRVAMTLAANRYRLDLVETLLRQNSTCRVHQLAEAVRTGDGAGERELLGSLDTVPRASGGLPRQVDISPGNPIRVFDGDTLPPTCMRQAHADRLGVLDLPPFLWHGDLPGGRATGALFARDLGPERNALLIEANPGRVPFVYMMPDTAAPLPILVPYDEGMDRIWGR
jgi:hypothetical protein